MPGPATLELLKGRKLRPSGPGERTTPTGAAMLAAWTEEVPSIPELTVQAIGYGAVVFDKSRSVPDAFRELAEKPL